VKIFKSSLLWWAYAPAVALVLLASAPHAASAADVTGELRKWHTVTVSFDGPDTSEQAPPNPFFTTGST
jgi:hypothetical protein